MNDNRPKLLALLEDQGIGLIVVEHKDRLTRFGFRYLDPLLKAQGRAIEVVNQAENGTEDWACRSDRHCLLVLRSALRPAAGEAQDGGHRAGTGSEGEWR